MLLICIDIFYSHTTCNIKRVSVQIREQFLPANERRWEILERVSAVLWKYFVNLPDILLWSINTNFASLNKQRMKLIFYRILKLMLIKPPILTKRKISLFTGTLIITRMNKDTHQIVRLPRGNIFCKGYLQKLVSSKNSWYLFSLK